MSTFLTKIPVDLDAVKKLLPPDSDLEGVTWNGAEVEVVWSNRHLLTPFSYPHPWPSALLESGGRPESVKERAAKPLAEAVRTPDTKAVDVKPKKMRMRSAK